MDELNRITTDLSTQILGVAVRCKFVSEKLEEPTVTNGIRDSLKINLIAPLNEIYRILTAATASNGPGHRFNMTNYRPIKQVEIVAKSNVTIVREIVAISNSRLFKQLEKESQGLLVEAYRAELSNALKGCKAKMKLLADCMTKCINRSAEMTENFVEGREHPGYVGEFMYKHHQALCHFILPAYSERQKRAIADD